MVNKFRILIALILCSGLAGDAVCQTKATAAAAGGATSDKYVASALGYLKANNPEQARQEIDKAFSSAEGKPGARTLLAKAQIYFAMNSMEKYKDQSLYREGTKALFKLAETKPDFEKPTVDQLFLTSAFLYYNDGAQAYNDKKLSQAPELMKNVVKIHDLGGGKRFEKFPISKQFDSVAADAYQIMASAAYFTGKYDDAIPLLITVKNNPITRTPSAFENLIYAYNIQKNSARAYEVIQEARKAFPDDMTIRNYELDYYVNNGKQDELLKKTDEALGKDQQNPDMYFDQAITYMHMAAPVDGKKPENAAAIKAKAEEAFKHAIALAPDNALYNYSFGTFYYNQASDLNDKMNDIKGTSDADIKRQDDLKSRIDGLFSIATPYFEKAYSILAANASSLRDEDKKAYHSTLLALRDIYTAQNKKDKAADMKMKYEAYNQ